MPTYLRRFYTKTLIDIKKKETEANKRAQQKLSTPKKPSRFKR